ncbi:catalase family protein [Granulicella sp. dw_53]|uniref:catalase family protein n=1 Tax=Granulicella sp. dw_53 TaxID=2719792 RepID=UPI001BD4E4C4|nr:catalase family protein [Granulicella sp. dw_53]
MAYLRYSPEVEVKQPDEDELIDKIVGVMSAANRQVFDKHRHATRDAHSKSHGMVIGRLDVYDNLPEHLAQGLFLRPVQYPVVIRLSSAPFDIADDRIPAPHGMAIKVIGVPGKKILPGREDEVTQDFALESDLKVLPFGTLESYWHQIQFFEKLGQKPPVVQEVLESATRGSNKVLHFLGIDNPVVDSLALRNEHILGKTFSSLAAIRYGDYVAKICVAPLSREVQALTGKPVEAADGPSFYRDQVVAFFQESSAEYEVRAQLCTDLERMPVENASIPWPEDESPYLPVARIVIPKQDAYSPERRTYVDDVLTFNPWHTIPEHRPLGALMRARNKAYETSTAFRHKMNAVKRAEPRDIREVPD